MGEGEIRDWLAQRIAQVAGIPPSEVDVNEPFSTYGLDSVAAVSLSGDLGDLLKVTLSPTLAWDYPSIARLSAYLASQNFAKAG